MADEWRIEKLWGTLQDRLLNEMTLAGIKDISSANEFLPPFIKKYNKKFQRKAAIVEKAYLDKVPTVELQYILCSHHIRKLDKGMSFSYKNRTFVLPYNQNKALLKAYASHSMTVLESSKFGIRASLVVGGKEQIVTPDEIAKRELQTKKVKIKRPITV